MNSRDGHRKVAKFTYRARGLEAIHAGVATWGFHSGYRSETQCWSTEKKITHIATYQVVTRDVTFYCLTSNTLEHQPQHGAAATHWQSQTTAE